MDKGIPAPKAQSQPGLSVRSHLDTTPFGFSMIELLIVLLIMGILLAYPLLNVKQHINRTQRLDGQMALLDLANRMERYHATFHTYQHASIGSGGSTDVLSQDRSPEGYYQLRILQANDNHYLLQAKLRADRAKTNAICATLTLNSQGEKSALGPDDCW